VETSGAGGGGAGSAGAGAGGSRVSFPAGAEIRARDVGPLVSALDQRCKTFHSRPSQRDGGGGGRGVAPCINTPVRTPRHHAKPTVRACGRGWKESAGALDEPFWLELQAAAHGADAALAAAYITQQQHSALTHTVADVLHFAGDGSQARAVLGQVDALRQFFASQASLDASIRRHLRTQAEQWHSRVDALTLWSNAVEELGRLQAR
jgi:hypothetical protein